jgi:MazG family protein
VVDAIDSGDPEEIKKELGDVFLHVLFHSRISEENGGFTIQDVIAAETEKLVRRHPHVFGDASVGDSDEVLSTWEEIKQKEREDGEETPSSVLDGVPRHLPALLQALRMQEKAAGVGFDFLSAEAAWEKVEEEIEEFRAAVDEGSDHERADEFGDVLFALVNYARYADVNPETALRGTNDKFARRVQFIEDELRESGRSLGDVTLREASSLWEKAKQGEE